jgi:hypothetical protein
VKESGQQDGATVRERSGLAASATEIFLMG